MLTKSTPKRRQNHLGFSLLELAIVLVILSVLFSGLLIPQNERQNQQLEQANTLLFTHIKKSLLGFFYAHKRLPCPASTTSQGEAVFTPISNSQCASPYGFLPFKTLGIQGSVNTEGLFLDAWKRPIRYHVSNHDHNRNNRWDWIDANEVATASTLSNWVGSFKICDKINCSNIIYAEQAVVVLHSQGKLDKQSPLEKENSGETSILLGNKILGMNNDNTFIYLPKKNLTQNHYFDDQLLWIAPLELYYYLVD